jgi:hypothetical protein
MRYVTVFDAAAQPLRNWPFPAFGLIFVMIGIVLVFKPAWVPFGHRWLRQGLFPWLYLLFAIAWTISSGLAVGLDSYRAVQALRSGSYSVVQGEVENFTPMPIEGHADEQFDVGGVHFAYSDFEVTAGFNNSASHGGPIRPGLPVRIAYRGNEILRLQVKR